MAKYKTKIGMDYLNKRVEAGEIVTDLPAKAIKWLRESGAIELVEGDAIEEEVAVEEPAVESEAE